MSMPEKRYFKLHASRNSSKTQLNNYVKLFDEIDKQEEYNENVVKENLKNESFIKDFKVVKNYLTDSILISLDAFFAEKSVEAQLKKILSYIEILFNRNMIEHCYKLIQKAKKSATENEQYITLLEILHLEYKVFKSDLSSLSNESQIKNHFNERKELQKKINNIIAYQEIVIGMATIYYKSSAVREQENMAAIKKLMNSELLADPLKALTNEALFYYFNQHAFYNYINNNLIDSFKYFKKVMALFESNRTFLANHLGKYADSSTNIILLCIKLNKIAEFEEYQKKLRAILNDRTILMVETNRLKSMLTSYTMDLAFHISIGNFENGVKIIERAYSIINPEKVYIDKAAKWFFHFDAAYILFGAGQLKEALKELFKIINDKNTNLFSDIRSFSNLLFLIIHYELENYDMLPYYSRSVYRQLLKRNKLFNYEKAILDFIRKKIYDKNNKEEYLEKFRELREKLIEISKDTNENKALDYFDVISWLESKLENKTFAEIIKNKVSKKIITPAK